MVKGRVERGGGRGDRGGWRTIVAGVSRTGKVVFVTFGRIGTKGQTQIKDLETDAAADAHVNRLIGEKTRKGYTEAPAT